MIEKQNLTESHSTTAKYVDQILPNFVLVHVDIDCHLAQKTRQIEADFSNGNPRLS